MSRYRPPTELERSGLDFWFGFLAHHERDAIGTGAFAGLEPDHPSDQDMYHEAMAALRYIGGYGCSGVADDAPRWLLDLAGLRRSELDWNWPAAVGTVWRATEFAATQNRERWQELAGMFQYGEIPPPQVAGQRLITILGVGRRPHRS